MIRPIPPIETQRLCLRPYQPEDLDALYAIHSRGDVTRYLYWGPRSRDQVREVLAVRLQNNSLQAEGDSLVLAILLRASGILIGDINLTWLIRPKQCDIGRQGEIGFMLHPDHHGHGFAREAAKVMLGLGFQELGFHRIIGQCDGRNTASARLMEGLGMRREAHFRQNERVKGEWCDEYVYAILAAEWER